MAAISVEERIRLIDPWINKAAKALMTFYNDKYGSFWRDTESIHDKGRPKAATSTCRAFFALFEYRRFLLEENLCQTDEFEEVRRILRGVCQKNLRRIAYNPGKLRGESDNEINMFTDSHILVAASILLSINRSERLKLPLEKIRKESNSIAKENLRTLRSRKGGAIHEKDIIHDFVTLHALRGIESIGRYKIPQKVGERARQDVLRLLGYHHSSVFSRFDPTELVFSTAVMNRFPNPESLQIFQAAIKAIVDSQNPDGSWPAARVVSSIGKRLLHVASYEVALTLTHLLIQKTYEEEKETWEMLTNALDQSFELVRGSFKEQDKYRGWSNDHARIEGLIESWATAIVLTFLIHYRDALLALRQRNILKKYQLVYTQQTINSYSWPDLEPALRQPEKPDPSWTTQISDPTKKGTLAKELERHFLRPILGSEIRRPGEKRALILLGEPGSRKTSLVKTLGKALNWPVLTLSPPDFLKNGGLEGFEATAQSIFDDLLQLRRIVVLFDECEGLFERRQKIQRIEARTVGAFITSGMLPRLQALRDKGWVLFVLAANRRLKEFDQAVKREGRFDFYQDMQYPTLEAQKRYLQRKAEEFYGTKKVDKTLVKELLRGLESFAKRPIAKDDSEAITFGVLDQFERKFFGVKRKPKIDKILSFLRNKVKLDPPSLMKD